MFELFFGVTCVYKKSRSVVTVRPTFTKMVSKDAEDLKVNSERRGQKILHGRMDAKFVRVGGGPGLGLRS